MRVKFGNKIYESDQIIYPAGIGKVLYVSYPKGSYEVTCNSEELANELFDKVLTNGYVDFNIEGIKYNNFWGIEHLGHKVLIND